MSEPAWGTFAGVTAFVTVALVALARASAVATTEAPGADARATDAGPATGEGDSGGSAPAPAPVTADPRRLSPLALFVNVVFSQGVLAALLLAAAWLSGVPSGALGLGSADVGPVAVAAGVVAGLVLYVLDEGLAVAAARVGVPYSEALRELLAPATPAGWAVLFVGVLPAVAAFEEFLFRGALVGAFAAGFPVSPWLLAVGSSALFGAAHGTQGPAGVVVTGLLGFGLAATFILTGSLLSAVVAHYLVNALEFAVHEGLDLGR